MRIRIPTMAALAVLLLLGIYAPTSIADGHCEITSPGNTTAPCPAHDESTLSHFRLSHCCLSHSCISANHFLIDPVSVPVEGMPASTLERSASLSQALVLQSFGNGQRADGATPGLDSRKPRFDIKHRRY